MGHYANQFPEKKGKAKQIAIGIVAGVNEGPF
jgi:hypothetical protein